MIQIFTAILSLTKNIHWYYPSASVLLLYKVHGLQAYETYVYFSNPARIPHLTNSIASTLSAERRDRMSVIVWPTDEKSRSDCAELAEMQ